MDKPVPPPSFAGRLVRVTRTEAVPSDFKAHYLSLKRAQLSSRGSLAQSDGHALLSSLEILRQEIRSMREELAQLRPESGPRSVRDVVTREELSLLCAADAGAAEPTEKSSGAGGVQNLPDLESADLDSGGDLSWARAQEDAQDYDPDFEEVAAEDNPFLSAGYGEGGHKRVLPGVVTWLEQVQTPSASDCEKLDDDSEQPWAC